MIFYKDVGKNAVCTAGCGGLFLLRGCTIQKRPKRRNVPKKLTKTYQGWSVL